jgi:hypothetical protein
MMLVWPKDEFILLNYEDIFLLIFLFGIYDRILKK